LESATTSTVVPTTRLTVVSVVASKERLTTHCLVVVDCESGELIGQTYEVT
jgi:hypothetical protein